MLSEKLSCPTEFIRCFVILFVFLGMLFPRHYKAQSENAGSAESLDALLQDYAYRALGRPRTGVPYDGTVPSNLTGISISALRLRTGSLKKRGFDSYKEFDIPPGMVVQPYVERLVLVYQNLGNWSSYYYPLPGYTHLTPVLGLLAYDGTNLSAVNLRELDLVATQLAISISFRDVSPVPAGTITKCVWFGLDGSPDIRAMESNNKCSTFRQGHFSIVVNSSEVPSPPPNESPRLPPIPGGYKSNKSEVWRIVGGVAGGVVALVLLALLVYWIQKQKQKKLFAQMEHHADAGASLDTARVGNAQVPMASGTRTQPVIENDLVA